MKFEWRKFILALCQQTLIRKITPPPPANMHSITTTMQYNTMAATNFSRFFATPFPTTSISYPIRYEMHNNESSVSNYYLRSNDSYHGFNSPN